MKTYSSYDEFLSEQLSGWWDEYFWDCPDRLSANPFHANTVVRGFANSMAKHIHKEILKCPGINSADAHILMLSTPFLETYGQVMSALASFTTNSPALPPAAIQQACMQRIEEIVRMMAVTYASDPDIIERTQQQLIEKGISQVPPPK